jgi:hypothetical protein
MKYSSMTRRTAVGHIVELLVTLSLLVGMVTAVTDQVDAKQLTIF